MMQVHLSLKRPENTKLEIKSLFTLKANHISTTWERSLPFLVFMITFLSWYNKVFCMYQRWQMYREKYNPTWCHGFSMLPSHFQLNIFKRTGRIHYTFDSYHAFPMLRSIIIRCINVLFPSHNIDSFSLSVYWNYSSFFSQKSNWE